MATRGFLILLAMLAIVPRIAAQTLLGVLEDVPGDYVGQPNVRKVRIVFRKNGSNWSAFRSDCPDEACLKTIASEFPSSVVWNIGFNGRVLGQITARTPSEFKFYSHVGLQDIASAGPIPTVGKKSADYSGFLGRAVERPLIANSQPSFRDPQAWKSARLSMALVGALRRQFRKKFPNVSNCVSPEQNIARPWLYQDRDIEITKAYSSKDNWSLAQLDLKDYRCDGPPEAPFIGQWFVINPEGSISFLGQDMWLVDAGDYDNDGRSEVVFAISGYDIGGYVLYYDDFKKRAAFEFGYH